MIATQRPTTMGFRSPASSRGTSPSRPLDARNNRQSPTSNRRMPVRGSMSPDRNGPRKNSGGSSGTSKRTVRSTGNSPVKTPAGGGPGGVVFIPRSRGSESGSIERLDESGNATRIITSHSRAEDNIHVVIRVRPLNNKEIKIGQTSCVTFPGNGQILCEGIPGGPGGGQKPKLFSYNVVFEPGATQEDVLQYSGIKKLIEMAVEGFSCTAFCYGQTGSGKTHTLTGPPGLFTGAPNPYSDDHGLVFRSFMYLFKILQEKTDYHFVLKASFLEIYNEKVIDLLNPGSARKPLAVRWSKKARGFFVENLFTVDCEELDDLMAVLEEGMRNRKVGSHSMNDHSSRSHTILTVHISSELAAEGGVFLSRQGKINFVDLAGSEMTKKTHSEGKTLEEANNINKSLMVLGYCISSLSDSKRKTGHIPYRDSKLTKLLADSLAGNGVTLMIACISPAQSNISETLNTLRYAARAKKIKTKPIVVMDPREALILSLKREVAALQGENEHLRSALHYNGEPAATNQVLQHIEGISNAERRLIPTPPHVDLEKLAELEGPELAELVKLYMTENEALRKENSELFSTREMLMRDQELVCRENERLLKKLEDVNSVCCRSPIIPARTTFSAEILNSEDSNSGTTNVWTNPLNRTSSAGSSDKNTITGPAFKQEILNGRVSSIQIPESIQKELDKRQIGNSVGKIAESLKSGGHRRHNSWDGRPEGINLRPTGSESADSVTSAKRTDYRLNSGNRLSTETASPKPKSGKIHSLPPLSAPIDIVKTPGSVRDSLMSTSLDLSPSDSLSNDDDSEREKKNKTSSRHRKSGGLKKTEIFGSLISLDDTNSDPIF